jgi:hypothetical protein
MDSTAGRNAVVEWRNTLNPIDNPVLMFDRALPADYPQNKLPSDNENYYV